MAEHTPEDESDQTVAAGVGHWLAEARKDRELTTASVAQALHLDVGIVEALESESFSELGATVFAKGHLRAVANYLGLDPDEAAERFHAVSGVGENKEPELIVSYHSRPARDRRWVSGALIGLLIALVVALAWVIWSLVKDNPSAATVPAPAISSAATPDNARNDSVTEANAPDTTTREGAGFAERLAAAEQAVELSEPALAETPEVSAGTDATVTQAAAGASVVLRFSDACGFEVRDADGNRVAYGTARPGLVRTLEAKRPLQAVFGVAEAVSISVDGDDFPITAAMRNGRTARVTIP